jgi:hypothetical protein
MKAVGCEGIVFSALVDDANISMRRGFLVGRDPVELPRLQEGGMPLVIEA